MPDAPRDIELTVNGTVRRLRAVPADITLLELLQEELALTGTKFGCGIGMCRACTVALRPAAGAPLEAVRACQARAAMLDGQEILTVEGLSGPPGRTNELDPLQQAFLEAFAFQCGYCAPGFLMETFVLLDRLRRAPVARAQLDDEIERACGEHVCRCTGYRRYHEAIRAVVFAEAGLTKE